jgi:hypothetical protein
MVEYMNVINLFGKSVARFCAVYVKVSLAIFSIALLSKSASAVSMPLDIVQTLSSLQALLMQAGPILSALLFVLAGIFYALGQLLPSYKRASLHTMAIDIIIGAIIVAVLSVTSNSFALASTHLLTNTTNATS